MLTYIGTFLHTHKFGFSDVGTVLHILMSSDIQIMVLHYITLESGFTVACTVLCILILVLCYTYS